MMQKTNTRLEKGIIQIYWGNGKGKTTAAIGQAVRALGQGMRVYMAQFLKPPQVFSGEMALSGQWGQDFIFRRPNQSSFLSKDTSEEMVLKEKESIQQEIEYVIDLLSKNLYDIFIFDELITALTLNLVDESLILHLLNNKPPQCEIILTGLKPTQGLLDKADLVTEMRMYKHPFQSGLKARRGIEY